MSLDLFINTKIASLQTPFLTTLMTHITNSISPTKIIFLSLIIIALLSYKKRLKETFLFILSIGGGYLLEIALKELVQRPRPTNALITETSYSFPSGHATIAIIFFTLLIYLFNKEIKNKTTRYIFIGVNIALILLIGLSRIYLNVHWLTDVLGGYALGLIWISILIKTIKPKKTK